MKQVVAVDIGSYLTKVAIVAQKYNLWEVLALNYFRTPYQKEDVFDEGAFFEQFFSVVPQAEVKTSQLAVGIPSLSTNFSYCELPAMARSDLHRAITSEAKRMIRPTPTDNDILRYSVIKSNQLKETRQIDVLAGAAIEGDVLRYFSLFEQQGIIPSFIGSSASSLMVYPLGYYPDLQVNWCVIDIGYTSTTIVIFLRNIPTLVRTILFATRDFVRAISAEKKVELEEAQRMFLNRGATELVNNSWDYLISEIRRSFAYYKEISAGKAIEGVYFTGGILSVGPYIGTLKKNIGGKVGLLDLASLANVSLEKVNPQNRPTANYFFASALGLALSVGKAKQVLNFLPASVLKQKQSQQVELFARKLLNFIAAGLTVLFCLLVFNSYISKAKLRREASSFSEEDYQAAISAEEYITDLKDKIKLESDFIRAQLESNQLHRKVFLLMAKYIPSNAYLTITDIGEATASAATASGGAGRRGGRTAPENFQAGNIFKCSGFIQATYEESITELKLFVKKLSKSGMFAEIELKPPKLEDEPFQPFASDFTLNVKRKFALELKLK